MKKFVLMAMMMVVGMTSFASLQENDNRLEEFTMKYQETQTVEMASSEKTEDLVVFINDYFEN